MTLLYWCCSNSNLRPSWGQLAAPYLYGQFGPLWCSMAFWPYHSSLAFYGLRSYPAIIGLPGQFFHIANPQVFILVFGPGGVLLFLGGSGSPSKNQPFGGLGPKWPLQPVGRNHGPWYIRCGPQSVGKLGPFLPNPMRPKGGSPLAHLSQFWPQNGHKDPQDPILANNHHGPLFSLWPLVTTRGHQISSAQAFPSP
ncbi:hypothetical protein O181_036315 [Austropuccinia psidii MF-1]|uniref:Uncharacterized protein n=1 Tax=Austropuccinia psidii MF-1 TaxID=1389203 RepID=A0A9Q3HC29_9BASI|nr:hypothetical protein [Austropuccinia psidii MF-1]